MTNSFSIVWYLRKNAHVQFDLQLRDKVGDDVSEDKKETRSMQKVKMNSCFILGIWISILTRKLVRQE